jgi:FAD/FMN-containing dehydrogenase
MFIRVSKKRFFGFFVGLSLLAASGWAGATEVVNDVTQLNPIEVSAIFRPTDEQEVAKIIEEHSGAISIGGGRFSMGGQTASPDSAQIDMRSMNKILEFDQEKKKITVQAGITWREIQEFIDRYDLSIKVMQTYDSFTVGGSLSVNCHGRYIGDGPIVSTVVSIHLALADGRVLEATPELNAPYFYAAIGGYGGIGVITQVTLQLADNVKVKRTSVVMPIANYLDYFRKNIENNSQVVFHNADIYPNAYDTVRATSYSKTDDPLTDHARLIPKDESYWLDRQIFSVITEFPLGKSFRQHVVDPIVFGGDKVVWRNHEASFNVKELEPSDRVSKTYVLQEYFVPQSNMEAFVSAAGKVLNDANVNVVNISIRHAKKDPGSLLAWAQTDVFAFVLYYKQGTDEDAKKAVAVWTRKLIYLAIENGGRHYLPYQLHATIEQIEKEYPRFHEYAAFKKEVDPTYKFRNRFLDTYYYPLYAGDVATLEQEMKFTAGYQREENQTYLTYPEWYLVYNPLEYANFIAQKPNSEFPYLESNAQSWQSYRRLKALMNERGYQRNYGYELMIDTILTSYSVENATKWGYGKAIGQWFEVPEYKTQEEKIDAQLALDYVDFVKVRPWYEYSFLPKLGAVWSAPIDSKHPARSIERKLAISSEFVIKSFYASLITGATHMIYEPADDEIFLLTQPTSSKIEIPKEVRVFRKSRDGSMMLLLPRYEAFQSSLLKLQAQGVGFLNIAGNKRILVSIVSDQPDIQVVGTKLVFSMPIPSNPQKNRLALDVEVVHLSDFLSSIKNDASIVLEHIYDY